MQAGGVVAGGVHGSTVLRRPGGVGCSLTQVRRQGSGRGSGFGRVVTVPAGDAAGGELIPRGTEEHRLRNANGARRPRWRSEEHTSELQSLMRISYAVFCWKKKKH